MREPRQSAWVFKLKNIVNPDYCVSFYKTRIGRAFLRMIGDEEPSRNELEELQIAIPEPAVQKKIVETVRTLRELTGLLEKFQDEIAVNPKSSDKISEHMGKMLKAMDEMSPSEEIYRLLESGETKTVEFKETFGLDVKPQKAEKYMEESALKTVVAFINSEGGELLIGVADDGQINGINAEVEKLHKKSTDKFLLHFKNRLKDRIGQGFYPLVEYDLIKVEEVHVLHIQAKKSDQECYLDNRYFYVRSGPSTDKLEGPKLVAYIKNRSAN